MRYLSTMDVVKKKHIAVNAIASLLASDLSSLLAAKPNATLKAMLARIEIPNINLTFDSHPIVVENIAAVISKDLEEIDPVIHCSKIIGNKGKREWNIIHKK